MSDGASIVHHPAVPLDRFVAIVQRAGLHRISVSASAVDAFGVIRLRSLAARHGISVARVLASFPGARASLFGSILGADSVEGSPDGLVITGEMLAAADGSLATAAARHARADGADIGLELSAWVLLANAADA